MRGCHHICDTTTRYDRTHKRLSFLLVCPECHSEQVLETIDYEPRPVRSARR
jgi:hypothetical protein